MGLSSPINDIRMEKRQAQMHGACGKGGIMNYKDIATRAGKTFIQAFLGVFIPVLVAYLNSGWPESIGAVWLAMAPALAASLAAGISAAWNYFQQLCSGE